MNVGELVAFLKLDTTGYTTGLSKAATDSQKYSQDLQKNFDAIKRVALVAFAAVSGVIVKAVSDAAKFEQEMAFVNTMLSGSSEKFLPEYAEALKKMSVQYGESTTALSKGLYDILSATIPAEQALGVLEQGLVAAKAGMTDTGTATSALVSMMFAFKDSAKDANYWSDILFATVLRGRTTFGELAGGIGRVATIAAAAGVSGEELAATLAVLTRAGLSTEEAVTSLRGILNTYLNPSKEATRTAAEMGIEFSLSALKAKGLGGALEDVSKLSPDLQAQLFGNIRALVGVTSASKDVAAETLVIQELMKTGTLTSDAYKKATDTFTFTWDRFKQAMKLASETIGKELLPILSTAFQALVVAIVDNRDAIEAFGKSVAGILKGLWDHREVVASIGLVVIGLVTTMKVVIPLVRLFGLAFSTALGPVALLITAATLVGGAIWAAAREGREFNAVMTQAGVVLNTIDPTFAAVEAAIAAVTTKLAQLNEEAANPSAIVKFAAYLSNWAASQAKALGLPIETVGGAMRNQIAALEQTLGDLQTKREKTWEKEVERRNTDEQARAKESAALIEKSKAEQVAAAARADADDAKKARSKEQLEIEAEYTKKVMEQSQDRIAAIKYEWDEAVKTAKASGADMTNLNKYFEGEITKEKAAQAAIRDALVWKEVEIEQKAEAEALRQAVEMAKEKTQQEAEILMGARVAEAEAQEKTQEDLREWMEESLSATEDDLEYRVELTLEKLEAEAEAAQEARIAEAEAEIEAADARREQRAMELEELKTWMTDDLELTQATVDAKYEAEKERLAKENADLLDFRQKQGAADDKATQALKDSTKARADDHKAQLDKMEAKEKAFKSVVLDTGKALKNMITGAVLSGLEAFGEAMGEGASTTEAAGKGLKNLGRAILAALPQLLLSAGLQLLPFWPVGTILGVGLLIASGLASWAGGLLKGRDAAAAEAVAQGIRDAETAEDTAEQDAANREDLRRALLTPYERELEDLQALRDEYLASGADVGQTETWYQQALADLVEEYGQAAADAAAETAETNADLIEELRRSLLTPYQRGLEDLALARTEYLTAGADPASVATWYQQAMADLLERYPQAAEGGLFTGAPGVDANLVRVSSGEFIMPKDITDTMLPVLEGMRNGQGMVISPAPVIINLDGREIGRGVVRFIQDESALGNVQINSRALRGTE